MPDVHWGIGATVGSVIPTAGAVIPAAVGVDIGCGMMAVQTDLVATSLPESLAQVRSAIERAVPHGRSVGRRRRDTGSWGQPPPPIAEAWAELAPVFARIADKHPLVAKSNHVTHLGTLGTGNHFIEVCLDESDRVWFMLHSGSRGVGNLIGRYFIELARQDMRAQHIDLPDRNLAYLPEGTEHFDDYVEAVEWAQTYARRNRELMMEAVIRAVAGCNGIPPFAARLQAVNCHHNYVAREHHYGKDVLVTRKGAVRAGRGDLGIIPGSMGARSYIVRGRGNPESFHSCSHGAGPRHVADPGAQGLQRGGPRGGDRRGRVPERRRRNRRNARRLQADRRGDGGPAGPGGYRTHPPPGRVCEGLGPFFHFVWSLCQFRIFLSECK